MLIYDPDFMLSLYNNHLPDDNMKPVVADKHPFN